MDQQAIPDYEFGPFRISARDRSMLRGNDVVPLPVKAFEVLNYLVRNHGQVVAKDVLIRHAWPDCFVEENNLNQSISALRRALADDADHPKYIETIPRRGYRFVAAVRESQAPAPDPTAQLTSRRARIKSLAVLPFQSIGSDAAVDFLDIGLADALITRLCNIEQIQVRPTASISGYKGADHDWIQAGAELHVDALLGGCIQRAGEKIRVTVQLVAAADGTTLWAGQFDEAFTDIFTVEDSISQQVARTLMLKLTSEESRRLSQRHTASPEAHQAYLRGRHYWNRRTEQELQKSVRCFQEAIRFDPGYALAYAGLADSYSVLGGYAAMPPKDSYTRARAAALHALEIEESLAEAHTSLADVFMYYDWNAADAGREYSRAIALRPDYATAHHFFAWYLIACQNFREASDAMRRAQDLDPLSPMINATVGLPAYFSRDFGRAIEHIEKAVEMDPDFALAHLHLGRAYLQHGDHARAIGSLRRAVVLSNDRPVAVAALGHALASTGHKSESQSVLDQLVVLSKSRYVSPYYVATVHAALGQPNDAFAWLEKAFADRTNLMVILPIDPALDALRKDPRMGELIRRVGFA